MIQRLLVFFAIIILSSCSGGETNNPIYRIVDGNVIMITTEYVICNPEPTMNNKVYIECFKYGDMTRPALSVIADSLEILPNE